MSVSKYESHRGRGSIRTVFEELAGIERELWLVVVVMLLADVWLTHLGIQHGLKEGNPAVRLLIETFGIVALAALKLLVLGMAGIVRELLPRWQTPVVPIGLALPWLGAVLVNGVLILRL